MSRNRISKDNNLIIYLANFVRRNLAKILPLILVILAVILLNMSAQKHPFIACSAKIIQNSTANMASYFEKTWLKWQKSCHNLEALIKTYHENIKLRQKIEEFETLKQNSDLVFSENKKLRELLYFVGKTGFKYKSARLLTTATGPYANYGILGAGSNHNLEVGQAILNDKGLIGRIIEVSATNSKILFVEDFNSHIPVITSKSRERAILVGKNNKELELLYLPAKSKTQIGEMIITSGDGKYYPAGIPVARISKIKNNNIYATSFLDLKLLEFVSILVN